jgi:hypothetical protein
MLENTLKFPQSVWALCFYRAVAKRWSFLAENQKFLLSRPARSAPKLVDAAQRADRSLDVRSCSELLLTAAEAAGLSLPQGIAERLELSSGKPSRGLGCI